MKRLLNELKPFKKPLIILGVFALVFLICGKLLPMINDIQANKSPIKSIDATNENIYTKDSVIKPSDFKITALHENGKKSSINSESIKIDKTRPDLIGEKTKVTVSLKESPEIKVICEVKNERKKLEEYFCGSPNIKDVKVVLYSNGELRFKGKGNVLGYDPGDAPWQNTENAISSVTFENTVTPESMDHWFEGFEELTFVDKLPSSVTSAVSMLSDCNSLENGVDWSACNELLDISNMYEGCQSIVNIPPIPSSVRNATALCRNCVKLQTAPDMIGAKNMENTTSMYEGCLILTETNSAPAIKIADNMYSRCINLRKAPTINEGIVSMEDMFSDDTLLVTASRIPESAKNISGCYSNCPKLRGEIVIDATTEEYGGIFSNSVSATTLNLKGKCKYLNEIALTNDIGNVYVNGKEAYIEEE